MPLFKKKNKTEIISLFFRQLASMLKAGIGVRDALDVLGDENEDRDVKRLAMEINQNKDQIEKTSSYLATYPDWFNHLLEHILVQDKPDNNLADMIFRVADDHETMEDLKTRFKSAMVYPATTLIIAGLVLALVLIFVIPTFTEMFESFGQHLPGPTLFVIHISNWISEYFSIIGLIMLMFIILLVNQHAFRDRVIMVIPGLNSIIKTLTMIRFSRYLSMMMGLNMPLDKAFESAVKTIPNSVYADKIRTAAGQVEDKSAIFDSLEKSGFYSKMALRILDAGEKSGSFTHALAGLAQYYEKSKIVSIEGTVRAFEITAFLTVAMVIGFFVIAMYLPIFMMAGAIV